MDVAERQQEWARFEQDMAAHGQPQLALASPSGSILLARSDFQAFEGAYETTPYLMLTLCLANGGRFRRQADDELVEGILRPGTFAYALPDAPAEGYWPRAQMLGIAVDLTQTSMYDGSQMTAERLAPAASNLHRDPLISSVMTALWHDAEMHGLSSAFFEHGTSLILNHLAGFRCVRPALRNVTRMDRRKLMRAVEIIESRLGSDLRMDDLAVELGQDVRTMTRAFRAATGLAPFEYLTARRMERAKLLLQTNLDVTSIAIEVGYANPSKFAAAFRRVCGQSPRDWRRQNR